MMKVDDSIFVITLLIFHIFQCSVPWSGYVSTQGLVMYALFEIMWRNYWFHTSNAIKLSGLQKKQKTLGINAASSKYC
jgi:hypothetical protein